MAFLSKLLIGVLALQLQFVSGIPTCPLPGSVNDAVEKIPSRVAPGASLSYKKTSICETTPGVEAFSGYIHLPSTLIGKWGGASQYNASIFFWYFESRNSPHDSPLGIYFGGGPGTSSMGGVYSENGPCYVNNDSNSTRPNPHSWNNNVNMLYIDQPVQTGFSYDANISSTLNLMTGEIAGLNGTVKTNLTFIEGVLPSQNPANAPNTTENAARIVWEALNIWTLEFPKYRSVDDRVSLWGNSYGGHWVPGIASRILAQNKKIYRGRLHGRPARRIELDAIGITNGCIDSKIEGPFYPEFAFNNTYGFKGISEEVYKESVNNATKPGGCLELLDQCDNLASIYDPEGWGANETVNAACALATGYCFQFVQGSFTDRSDRNPFDISLKLPTRFPPDYMIGFLNQAWVRKDLGVPVNFSISAPHIVNTFFTITGDPIKSKIGTLSKIAKAGVKIALIHGDKDYRCNWLGGEAVSLAIDWDSKGDFRAAGYAPIQTNESYVGGYVRQHGALSFSRVLDAGHAVGAYQPQTVSQIFDRVVLGSDVATGEIDIDIESEDDKEEEQYSTEGPASVFHVKNSLPDSSPNECYLLDAPITCTDKELAALGSGQVVVKDFIVHSAA